MKRAKLLTTALRSFLQYARYRGKIRLDLAAAVPPVANWSMSSIPRAIAPGQVRRLLASVDRRTAIGCRDYAILLLLARLGLRAGGVACLELDAIDWNLGQLTVRGKSGQRSHLSSQSMTELMRSVSWSVNTSALEAMPNNRTDGRATSKGADGSLGSQKYAPADTLRSSPLQIRNNPFSNVRRQGQVGCVKEPRLARSETCWVTAAPKPPKSIPKWISMR
jgi:hypothetical protein